MALRLHRDTVPPMADTPGMDMGSIPATPLPLTLVATGLRLYWRRPMLRHQHRLGGAPPRPVALIFPQGATVVPLLHTMATIMPAPDTAIRPTLTGLPLTAPPRQGIPAPPQEEVVDSGLVVV